ncbi:MAG: bifunctional riboflavin kinase/FMN adenylyltransferase [Tannerella sp.]|jgi:riboflavin kinase/FMN adenylyltransferase|nr:bifunctional riboflavin kinase/FMN adenylyltransferase [Tannerella sp.]
MRVIDDIKDWKEKAIVATIGFFDGVHSGHRFLIEEMRRVALERNIPAAVITFPVHPRMVLQSDYQPRLLNSYEERLHRLSETGIDYVIVMNFTPSMAMLTAREFIVEILSAQWGVKILFVGYDHRFGHLRSEGFEQYVVYGKECGMEVLDAGAYSKDGVTFSSSVIRQLLRSGDVSGAARVLGYFYRLKGHVVNGYRIGRSIGFPTANIAVDENFKVLPAAGSYAVWVVVDGRKFAGGSFEAEPLEVCRGGSDPRRSSQLAGKRFKGMLYIGSRPTVHDNGDMSIEVNIFDFSEDIYDEAVTVEFVEFIRGDMKFDSLDELTAQMHFDKQKADELLEKQKFGTENYFMR